MYDLPRLNDRWATKTQAKKQIFQKHVDGEGKIKQEATPYSAWLVQNPPPHKKKNSNQISFHFLRRVMHTCVYDCAFSACDLQRYLLVVSVVGRLGVGKGRRKGEGGLWQWLYLEKTLRAEIWSLSGGCDQSLCVRCVVEMDFSCFP